MKRILLFALVLALLLTFVGCTGNGKDKSTNETETGSSEPGTTNSGKDNSGGTEPSGEHTGTNPAESGTTNTDNLGGVELPIDYFG